jgi:hypothetical protein
MSPSGKVEIGGVKHDARADGMFIPCGAECILVRADPTGLVVRPIEPGQPVPQLPNHGQPVGKAEFQRNRAEVAEAEEQERRDKRARLRKAMKYGSVAAAAMGAMVGLVSAGGGWYFGGTAELDANGLAVLLAGSAAVGIASAVVLFFLTGWVGSLIGGLTEGEPGFTPSFFATFAGLVGAAGGFWWGYPTGDPLTIAGSAVLVGLVSAAVAWIVALVGRQTLEAIIGDG